MDFVLAFLAPRVERVVHDHPLLQHLMVVWKGARKPKGYRGQPRGLRRQIEFSGIRGTHYQRQPSQSGIRTQAIGLDEGVETAMIAIVREMDVWNVIGHR